MAKQLPKRRARPRPAAGKQTSRRFVRTAADEAALAAGYWFDEEAAERVFLFLETFCHLTKGEHAGPIKLLPWQRDEAIGPLFGWKRPDGTRRFRKAFWEVPKKNGKSSLCSGLSIYMTVGDGEPGAECGVAAVDQNQASIVWDECANMVDESPDLAELLAINRNTKRIYCPETHSFLRAFSSDANSKEGLNLHFLCADEIHAWKDRKFFGALKFAGIARRQPLCPLIITTAGDDLESLGHEEHEYARKIIAGTVTNHEYHALIYAAEPAADFKDPAAWKQANPSLGTTIKLEELAQAAAEAEQKGQHAINEFRRYRLNQWVKSDARAIRPEDWNQPGNTAPFSIEALAGRLCYAGVDIGWQEDQTALGLVFPDDDGGCKVLVFVWIPEDAAREYERRGFPYSDAAAKQQITLVPGAVMDNALVKAKALECRQRYFVRRLHFDPRDCRELALSLRDEHGFEVVEHPQTYTAYNEPFKTTLDLITDGRFRHNGDRMLTWAADNLKVRKGTFDDIMPARPKQGSAEKVDPMVAVIMAVAAWTKDPTGSVYESRGIRTV